ncbi:MAG: hypothetical protein WC144_03915 [Sulfurimonas sp.]|jgi:hypothetical protein|nr:hypothetical protein [Sulfurimonadaceae bacterium]
MLKYILIAVVLVLSGCHRYEIHAPMCDDITPKSDPALIRKCRNYNEEEATKAFNKTKPSRDIDDIDIMYGDEK